MMAASRKSLITATNVVYLLAGLFFIAVSALDEGSVYSVVAAVLCFVSIGLALKEQDWFFASPFRVATAVFVLALTITQLYADFSSPDPSALATAGSVVINGVLFIVFLGVTMVALHPILKLESEEEKKEREEEEAREQKKKAKKITYEV